MEGNYNILPNNMLIENWAFLAYIARFIKYDVKYVGEKHTFEDDSVIFDYDFTHKLFFMHRLRC
jgi:hypothetical protein